MALAPGTKALVRSPVSRLRRAYPQFDRLAKLAWVSERDVFLRLSGAVDYVGELEMGWAAGSESLAFRKQRAIGGELGSHHCACS